MATLLQRVSAVLSQFIKPVASSAQKYQEQQQNRGRQNFQRQKPENKSIPVEADKGKVIPFPALAPPAESTPKSSSTLSVAHSFIQLVQIFKQHKGKFIRWIAHRSYQAAAQRKTGRYRKGSMINIKVE